MRRGAIWLASIVLAVVFIVAALPKIAQPDAFALAIFHHQLAPPWAINAMAIYLPWLEVVAGVLLLVPRCRAGAAAVILAMLLVFTAAIAINLYRGLDIACGCFSVSPGAHKMGGLNLVRNAVLLALAGYVWAQDRRAAASAAIPSRP